MKRAFLIIAILETLAARAAALNFSAPPRAVASGFCAPPRAAAPHVWWHWMNGCISREGIVADLDAMHDAGLGGATIFFVGRPPMPDGPVRLQSEEWYDLVVLAVREAKKRGLEIGLHNCPGWSSTGGPWIKPENAMKTVYASVTIVKGPQKWRGTLRKPAAGVGGWFRDLAVTAYPKPPPEATVTDANSRLFKTWHTGSKPQTWKDEAAIRVASEIDLTGRMEKDGTLAWDVPAGEWAIQRTVCAADDVRNHPTKNCGEGLECDKLSRDGIKAHWEGFIAPLLARLGKDLYGADGGLRELLIDSYELPKQNWTLGLEREFARRRGYRLEPYWPVFAGKLVGSAAETDRFTRDFRLTVSELFAENYAGGLRDLAHAAGLRLACEGYGSAPVSELAYSLCADVPMCEFWSGGGGETATYKLAAAAAHLNGTTLVGAEALSGTPWDDSWRQHPATLRPVADYALSRGVTRFSIHSWVHQPWLEEGLRPGLTLGPYGIHFNRNETWMPLARSFVTYLTRCQHLLRQGAFVGDICHFFGDYVGTKPPSGYRANPRDVTGYDWDFCDASALRKAHVEKGALVLPRGGMFRVLALPKAELVSDETRHTIARFAREGLPVVAAEDVEKTLRQMGLPPDVQEEGAFRGKLRWMHRKAGETNFYFVARAGKGRVTIPVTFRLDGFVPELWNAEDGSVVRAAAWSHPAKGRTTVPLAFDGDGSIFVVFRHREGERDLPPVAAKPAFDRALPLDKGWSVRFRDPALPEAIRLEGLADWTTSTNDAVKFYSGIAEYRIRVTLAEKPKAAELDLGRVCDLAEVSVNGRTSPALWHAPFTLDISDSVAAENEIVIRVANRWPNRLIGDERLPLDVTWNPKGRPDWDTSPGPSRWGEGLDVWPAWFVNKTPRTSGRRTFATWRPYKADSPLLPSGLIGPVILRTR